MLAVCSGCPQVSHSDTCVCLKCWNKCVGLWFVRGMTLQNWNYSTRDSAFWGMNSWLAACCVCFSLGGGGGLWVEPTMNCGNPWRVAAEPIKEKSILFFWNSPRPQTCINRFCLIIAQPYHSNYVFKSKLSTNWTMFECCLNRVRCKCLNKLAAGTSRPIKASHLTRRQN